MENTPRQSPVVLVVEDTPTDVFLLEMAAREICPDISFVFQPSGQAALQYLQRDGGPHSSPALILLDHNLPDMKGLEVLRRLRSTPGLSQLHVLLWTQEADLKEPALQAGADGFVLKTLSFDGLLQAMVCIALDARAAAAQPVPPLG